MFSNTLKPGITLGNYPQKKDLNQGALEFWLQQGVDGIKHWYKKTSLRELDFVTQVNQAEQRVSRFSDQEFAAHIRQQKRKLHRDGLVEEHVVKVFATIREISKRTLERRHYDVQIRAAWAMLNGMVVEMATGEGKTITAALTSCTAAMAGIPVHVVTANDYLAQRDHEILEPLYQQLGLSSAYVIDGMNLTDRHMAYQSNIVHITSQQLVFDYLRDRISIGEDAGILSQIFKQIENQRNQKQPVLLKGLCFAIIDEIDSVLIDEARTPLVISETQTTQISEQIYFDALFLAGSLDENQDFIVDSQLGKIDLTQEGEKSLEASAVILDKKWHRKKWREFWVVQALSAKYLYEKNKHYLVANNKVVIVDENTGRAMSDRSWQLGLQQMIEAKENCQISQENLPVGKISYQRFFRRYLKLAGMSGTVKEVAKELKTIYSLPVVNIPTHKPCKRVMLPERLYKTTRLQHQALLASVQRLHELERPVLIATRTVAESEQISQLLTRKHLSHQLINARNDCEEAEIIAQAGEAGSITVATNMAGRGTDIQPDKKAIELGGLHVIATSRNIAKRIDRQLYGRSARQGDPGSCEGIFSLQDEHLEAFYSPTILRILTRLPRNDGLLPNWLTGLVLRIPQFWLENYHFKTRKRLLFFDKQQAKTLAFTGRKE